MFANLSRRSDRQGAQAGQARRRKRRPSVEALEGRQLMSLGAEFIGPINTTTRNAQFGSNNATNAGGESVVVWTDTFSSTDHDIRAQRYNSFGGKLGPEIVVSFSGLDEGSPSVAIDGQGRFEVAWTQFLPGGDSNVVAQRFDANGNKVGDVIQVGAGTFQETDPDVATDLAGDFVVSYTRNTNNNNPDIFAKEYNNAGQLLRVVDVATTTTAETHSSVSMSQFGLFDVAYEQAFSATDHDVYLNRYAANGTILGRNVISFSTLFDQTPSVSMDNAGDAVVAWEQNDNIAAVRVSSTGSQGAQINIASTSNLEFGPSVALKPGGGGFVVTYESLTSTSAHAKVAEVSATNTITTFDAGSVSGAAVSFDAFGDYLVTYTGSDLDIHGRRGLLLF
jgi:hypothetical protein